MTRRDPETLTSFTPPEEITDRELAEAYVKLWERQVAKLPKSFPARVRKAYAQRLALAQDLLASFPA
jgi:hypothetical protein